jgi:hypothetical protein
MTDSLDKTFNPATMANDLSEVHRIYADFFAELGSAEWEKPSSRGPKEWSLRETIAHLCALNGAGLESIKYRLQDKPYAFEGLDDRYAFNAYNRQGIDEHLGMSREALCAEFLDIHDEAANIARNLRPDQAELIAQMPIYNRPVQLIEALGIIFIHAGIFHSTQVTEPAGQPPLWTKLSPEIRHRGVGREATYGRFLCSVSMALAVAVGMCRCLQHQHLGGKVRQIIQIWSFACVIRMFSAACSPAGSIC